MVRAGKIRSDYGRNEASELDEESCKKENRAAMETGLWLRISPREEARPAVTLACWYRKHSRRKWRTVVDCEQGGGQTGGEVFESK